LDPNRRSIRDRRCGSEGLVPIEKDIISAFAYRRGTTGDLAPVHSPRLTLLCILSSL